MIEDICNRALDLAGYKRHIGSIWEGTLAARIALDQWGETRDAVLSAAPWEFARGEISLSISVAPPPNGWAFRYDYPSAMLMLTAVRPGIVSTLDPVPVQFQEYFSLTRYILASVPSAFAVGTIRVTDVTLYPPPFEDALIRELANRFRGALLNDAGGRSEQRARPDQKAENS